MADVDATLNERGQRYGAFADHAAIAQSLKDVMRSTPGWARLNATQKEALEMQAHKQARILNGDPNYADSWHDIAGYSRLVEQTLGEDKPVSPTPAPVAAPQAAPVAPVAPVPQKDVTVTLPADRPVIPPVPPTIPAKIPDRPPV